MPMAAHLLVVVLTAAASVGSAATILPKEALPTKFGYLRIPVASASIYYAFYVASNPVTPPATTPLLVWLEGGPALSSFASNFFQVGRYVFSVADSSSNTSSAFPLSPTPTRGTAGSASSSSIARSVPATAQRHRPPPSPHPSPSSRSMSFSRSSASSQDSRMPPSVPARSSSPVRATPARPSPRPARHAGHKPDASRAGADQPARRGHRQRLRAPGGAGNHARRRSLLHGPHRREAEARGGGHAGGGGDAGRRGAVGRGDGRVVPRAVVAAQRHGARVAVRRGGGGHVAGGPARRRRGVDEQRQGEGGAGRPRRRAVGARQPRLKSAKREVEALLRGPSSSTRVLLYEGIRDAQVGVVSVEAWLRELDWDGLAAFQDAPRAVWRQESGGAGQQGRLAGYVPKHDALVHVAVYAAGHFVPAAQEMIEDWVCYQGMFSSGGAAA